MSKSIRGRRAAALAVCIAAAALLAGCGPGQKAAAPQPAKAAKADLSDPKLAALVQGAKSEGTLVFVNTFEGGAPLIGRLERGFNDRYGLNVKVVNRTTSNMPTETGKLIEEFRSKRPSSVDAILGSENNVVSLIGMGAILPVDWSWSKTMGAVTTWGGGGVVPVMSRLPGITYSTERVKQPPKTIAEFVASNQPIATTAYGATLNAYAQPEIWGEAKARAFVKTLSAKAKGVILCGETARILSGEFDLFGPNCGISEVLVEQKKGAPLGYVIPRDAPIIASLYIAIPANTPHPNAAKLWAEYMLSREAQDILYDSEAADNHRLPGSKTAPIIHQLEGEGVKFVNIDVGFVQKHAESMQRMRGEFQRMLQK